MLLYLVYLFPYFYFGYNLSEYTKYQRVEYFNIVAYLFLLFFSGMYFGGKPPADRINLLSTIRIESSKSKKVIYLFGLVALLFMTLRQGQNVIGVENSYQAYRANLESTNSMPLILVLYLIFFLPIMGRRYTKLFYFASIIAGLFCITRGMRMVLAPICLLVYAQLFENKVSNRKLLILFILVFLTFIAINALKMSMDFNLKSALSEGTDNYIISHHADNLYIGATSVGLVKNGTITFFDRILLNIGFISEAVVPPTFLPDTMKFPHIVNILESTGGGGLFLVGGYLMWGYWGLFLFGLLISHIICYGESPDNHNNLVKVCTVVICVFFPRWMSYDFHVILRFTFFATIIYLFFNAWKKHSYNQHI